VKNSTAIYGARVHGSVFRFKFQLENFEFVETYPGFAQLYEKNGFKVIKNQ
jgi:hypothetical protein